VSRISDRHRREVAEYSRNTVARLRFLLTVPIVAVISETHEERVSGHARVASRETRCERSASVALSGGPAPIAENAAASNPSYPVGHAVVSGRSSRSFI